LGTHTSANQHSDHVHSPALYLPVPLKDALHVADGAVVPVAVRVGDPGGNDHLELALGVEESPLHLPVVHIHRMRKKEGGGGGKGKSGASKR
jgi:hypothetical protein